MTSIGFWFGASSQLKIFALCAIEKNNGETQHALGSGWIGSSFEQEVT
jgi:hypothetical protein